MADYDFPTEQAVPEEVWGVDDATFNFASLEELIEAYGDRLEVGQEVFVGEQLPPDLEALLDVDGLLEDIQDRATERYGECAEEWLGSSVPEEARAELAELLANWVLKHCPPDFYAVRNSRGHVLTEGDFELPLGLPPVSH